MTLARVTQLDIAVTEAMDAARAAAIEEFAQAKVEEVMLKAAETRLRVLEARRQLVLKTFNTTDVAKLGAHLSKNKYAAEKLQQIFGGTFELLKDQTGRPLCDIQIVKDDPDVGEVRVYTYYGRYTRPDGIVVEQMGSFSTKAPFFAKADDAWKPLAEIDVTDVMVAAQTEAYKKCIFRGVGLGDWTESEGTALAEAKGHAFQGAQSQSKPADELVIPFGKHKGKKLTEADDETLAFLLKATLTSLEDPDKKRFRAHNEKLRDAIKAEQTYRAGRPHADAKAGPEASPPNAAPNAGTGAAVPISRGGLIKAAWDKLVACAKDEGGKKTVALLGLISQERWNGKKLTILTDLTDEQLREILTIPDDILATAATTIAG